MSYFPFNTKKPPTHGQLFSQIDGFGVPPTPPGSDALIQLNGFFILQLNGSRILIT